MLGRIFAVSIVCLLFTPTMADEAVLQSEYQAYRSAINSGDMHGALPHAEAAYNEAGKLYNAQDPDIFRYVSGYARVLNDLVQYQRALDVLLPTLQGSSAGQTDFSFEILFESGRSLRGLGDFDTATEFFSLALTKAETRHGEDSIRAAYAHLELARPMPNLEQTVRGDALRNRIIGTGRDYSRGSAQSLDRADEIFAQHPELIAEPEILNVIRGGNLLADGNRRAAGEYIEPAVETLAGYGYMDDFILTTYIDWVASHLTHWSTNRMERYLLQALAYGQLRLEGAPVPLARTAGVQHRRACVDRITNGQAVIEYSINAEGQVPRTSVVRTDAPDWWISEQRAQMRSWAFVPAQSHGEPVRIDGIQESWVINTGNSC